MATQQAELTTEHAEWITEPTELIEKLNCLEFETSQLNRAYQLWRPYIEQETAPDWMAVAISITYDALIWTTEPTELTEKLNCLEFETSELNRAYQLWRPYVEQETAPDWMAAAISITYSALIKFYLDAALIILPDVPHTFSARNLAQPEAADCEISDILEEEGTTALSSPELPSMTEPDWAGPEMLVAISPPSTGDAISELRAIARQQIQQEEDESRIAELSPELLAMTEPDWAAPEMPVVISSPSTGD